MQEIEKTGKSVDEAIEAALTELGVAREEAEIEVLAETGRGLLGIFGQTEARVKVTRKTTIGKNAAAIVEKTLAAMDLAATVHIKEEDAEGALIEIDAGEDTGLIIGRRGDTLNALQYLVALLANRGQTHSKRVLLNAGGYLERREQALTTLAQRTAHKVRNSGRAVTLEALSPRERRIVHLALADEPGVATSSIGTDPNRCVVVSPAKSGSERRPQNNHRRREQSPSPSSPSQPPWQPDDAE